MKGLLSFWACVLLAASVGTEQCLPSNMTVEQLLDGNPHLRAVYDELQPSGFLSAEGLKSLMTQLLAKLSSCSALPSQDLSQGREQDEQLLHHLQEDPQLAHGTDDHIDHDHSDHSNDGHAQLGSHEDHNHNHDPKSPEGPQPASKDEDDKGHDPAMRNRSGLEAESRSLPPKQSEKMIAPKGTLTSDHHPPKKGEPRSPQVQEEGHAHDAVVLPKNCIPIEDAILSTATLDLNSFPLHPEAFVRLCPAILNSLLRPSCEHTAEGEGSGPDRSHAQMDHGYHTKEHTHHHNHAEPKTAQMTRDTWIAAILSMVLIGLIAFLCIMIIPVLKRSKYYILINHFLLALAVGSLAGDALIHLFPHAMTMDTQLGLNGHLVHALYGFTAFVGILLFLLMERLHNLIGHKHSHGHGHESPPAVDGDELVKEIGIISAELNETRSPNLEKIGEKLSQHSKHSSFIYTDSTSPSDPPRGCFESCPPNLVPGLEDPNGNSGNVDSMVCKSRAADQNSASLAECERLVNSQPRDKNDPISSSRTPLAAIPPPPLVQSSPPKSIVRQDSKNFNMVLQEYHVGHHGHSHHGHSHVTGKKDSLRTMILLGDGMHTFMDGMAIGAAFGTSLTGGIATAIAVLCHELPHKVGDFAILFEMGMKRRHAVKMVLALWVLSLLGLALGVSIGSIQSVSPWIYCFTAGVFLYLALVDLLSELSINGSASCSAASQMALQVSGMLTGSGIMLVIAIYEHDLERLLEGAF